MTEVKFYECNAVEEAALKFAVILTRAEGKWMWCRHRDRATYEVPGGHRDAGETILQAARRELYEETGALRYSLRPLCVYSVTRREGAAVSAESFGMLYGAEVSAFEGALHHEIAETALFSTLPPSLTYPDIQPKLLERAMELGFGG